MCLTFQEVGVFYTYRTFSFEMIEKAFGNDYKRRTVSQSAGAWTFARCRHSVDQRLQKQAYSEAEPRRIGLSNQ